MIKTFEPVVMNVHLPAGTAGPDALDFDVRCHLVPHASGVVLIDTAMTGSSPLIELDVVGSMAGSLTRGPAPFTADPDMAEQSLHRLAELSAELSADRIVFSHGEEIPDPTAALQRLAKGE